MTNTDVWAPFETLKPRLMRFDLQKAFSVPTGVKFRKELAFGIDSTSRTASGGWKDIAGALGLTDAEVTYIETRFYDGGLTRDRSPVEAVLARVGRRVTFFGLLDALRSENRWDVLRVCASLVPQVCEEVEADVGNEIDPAAAEALEESFGLAPLLRPVPDADFVLLVAAEDGFPLAERLAGSVARKCVLLNSPESEEAMFIDDESFAVESFCRARYVVPVVTKGFIDVVSLKNRGVREEVIPLNRFIRQLHDFMHREVLRKGLNPRFRPVVSRDVVLSRSLSLDRIIYLRQWKSEDSLESLAVILSR